MADNTSGVNGSRPPARSYSDEAGTKATGKHQTEQVAHHEPEGSKLDRTPAKTAQRRLNERAVSPHLQTRSIQNYDVATIRRLALTGQWEGVVAALKLHVSNEADITQLLNELGSELNFPADVQNSICNEFSIHCANRTAEILIGNLSEDSEEAHGTLLFIIDHPEHHDSPIGFLSRLSSKKFVARYGLNQADLPLLISNTAEHTYDLVVKQIEQIEQQRLSGATAEAVRDIQNSQNERMIEMKYRRGVTIAG